MKIRLHPVFYLLLFAFAPADAPHAADAGKHPYRLPPNVSLHYNVSAKQHGFSLNGQASLSFESERQNYLINNELRATLLGKVQESKSQGVIDEFGIAPQKFSEKRWRKDPYSVQFDRERQTISFSESNQTYPIKGGEQDRTSVTWQLSALARANSDKMRDGSEWTFFVVGRRDADVWKFKVVKHETLQTALGTTKTVHFFRAPPPDSQDQQLDIWLAPSLDWLPVRLRFADANGDFVEQTITRIEKRD